MSKKKRKNSDYKKNAVKVVTPETTTVEFVPFEYEIKSGKGHGRVSSKPMASLHHNTKQGKYTRLAMNKAASELMELLELEYDEGYAKVDVAQNKNTNEFLITAGTQETLTSKISGKGGRFGINGTDFCEALYKETGVTKFEVKLWKDEGILLTPKEVK